MYLCSGMSIHIWQPRVFFSKNFTLVVLGAFTVVAWICSGVCVCKGVVTPVLVTFTYNDYIKKTEGMVSMCAAWSQVSRISVWQEQALPVYGHKSSTLWSSKYPPAALHSCSLTTPPVSGLERATPPTSSVIPVTYVSRVRTQISTQECAEMSLW